MTITSIRSLCALAFAFWLHFTHASDLFPRHSHTQALADTVTITVTSSIPEPTGTFAPSYTNYALFIQAALDTTNFYRYEHSAPALTWNESLAAFSAGYASQCAGFKHSGRSGVGENIVLGASNATSAIEAFGDERKDYDYHNPGFTEQTGHFTQLVWVNTTSTGCGAFFCDEDGIQGIFMVCQYYPPGNVGFGGSGDPNQFYESMVLPQANDGQGFRDQKVEVAYAGSGTTSTMTATNTIGPGPTGGNQIGGGAGLCQQTGRTWWAGLATTLAALLAAWGMS